MINNTEQLLSLLGNDEAELIHGDERYQLTIETRPHCTQNCPAGINVKGYVNLIANRRYAEALELIREMNPFPGICGRVCTRPCEINCNPDLDEPLSIKALKRFVADYEVSRMPADIERYQVRYREKVAVIGSGPAGLTTALDLVRLGYAVTVFEAMNKAGGMLTWGIPEFRLPRNVLEREIGIIESMGVEIRTGKRIEDPTSLFSEGYNAVVIAAGSWKGLPLEIEGEDLEGVVDCLEFLRMVSRRELRKLSGRVVVIGGGESAIDASRTALRFGADAVTLAYRRTENEMPAEDKEICDTREEGAEIMTLAIPKRIIGDGRVEGIEFLRAELGDLDESGRRRPIPIRGSEFVLECDCIIPAISARPGVPEFKDRGICFNEKGLIDVDEAYQSCTEGIFAVGDAVRGPSTIVDVIGSAHRCAASIHAFLGSEHPRFQEFSQGTRAGAIVHKAHHRPKHRHPIPTLSLDERLECFQDNERQCFVEIEDVYSELVAVDEASRCFRCGPCEECQVCLPNCTEKQVVGSLDGKEFLLKVPCELSREVHEGKKDNWELSVNNE
ncbi:MAG: FAD-dependent oxidoreductase, partial [Thermoplasmata archaeon]|nr:FAD-dependent oxidoreductase [Thermoplasmata archaeon]